MAKKTRHTVTFFSPGTLFAEMTTKDIDSWDVDKAVKMARKVTERYNSKPYAFQFATDELTKKKNGEVVFKTIKESKRYYLGGKLLTLEQVKARKDPKDSILISNMECNHWPMIIVNDNSERSTHSFDPKEDELLDVKL